MNTEIKARFEAAIASFTEKIKNDSNVRAVILYGSLANGTVWEKSDMDVYILVRELKCSQTREFCIEEDGLIINVALREEFDFKRGLERSISGDWTFSMFSGSRVMYAKDDSLRDFLLDYQKMGADDRALSFFQNSTWLLGVMEKIEKWLTVKNDTLYAQLWCLKAAEQFANMRLILDGKPPSREAVVKVNEYAPEVMRLVYERPLQGAMNREEIPEVLALFRKFLADNLDLLKQPIAAYMSDGAARTLTTVCKHFAMSCHEIYHVFDFLEEMGVVARVTESTRLTPKSRTMVEELAFIYVDNMGVCQ